MKVPRLAPRGLIYDRFGHLIAGIRREVVVTAVPKELKGHEDVIDRVISVLGADAAKVHAKLKEAQRRPYVPSPIFVGASIEAATKIAECSDQFPGIRVESQPMRMYTDSKSFTHVLGYVWLPNDKDVERIQAQGLDPAPYVGKSGIERAYESHLMGDSGAERLEVDAKGRPVRQVGQDEAVPGEKLELTIDASLQSYVTQLLAASGHSGGVVALDPSTGEVLCLASSPTYDASMFLGGITDSEWNNLNSDPKKPMLDRAIYSSYSPGSTFKIVTSLAAYRAGRLDPNVTITCNGGFTLNKHEFKCLGHHGPIRFAEAFEKSCNTYFATLGHSLGHDALVKAALDMGLGDRTGIEIEGEGRGLVPTNQYLTHRKHPIPWYGGDTVNFSIGQGYVRSTPLQMANLVAMVANRGVNYKPHLVRRIVDPIDSSKIQTIRPQISHQVSVGEDYWSMLISAMQGVIDHGTGARATIPGLSWAGKTGSTEHGKGKLTHAWFVGFAPVDHPKIAVCVLFEDAGHGGDEAAPIARAVVKHYLMDEPAAEKATIASEAFAAKARSPKAAATR